MNPLAPRERLLGVLGKKLVDRPPVICTGGMMNAAIVEVMQKTGLTLPEAHFSGAKMAALRLRVNAAPSQARKRLKPRPRADGGRRPPRAAHAGTH